MQYTNGHIEALLPGFHQVLRQDYAKYRNHVYRVFLACLTDDPDNEEKYAIAAVYHDIGIWTANTLDYLHPSIQQLEKYLVVSGKEGWIGEIALMVYWHHKIIPYKGLHWRTVENFRKADWADVTFGLAVSRSGKKARNVHLQLFPYLGFHRFLFGRIARNWLRHPLNPLPMFKR